MTGNMNLDSPTQAEAVEPQNPVLRRPQLVVVDLDGTMVDSVPDLAYCVDLMREHLHMPPHGEAKVREWVGNGVERLVRRALVGTLNGEPDEELFSKAYPVFLELYRHNVSARSTVYQGVRDGLDFLVEQNLKLGCITNKAEAFTVPLLKDLDLYDYFDLIVSGDSLPKKKPHPLPLLHAAQHFHVAPEDSLLVGDSMSDVRAARAAGFQVVCTSYGYNHGEDIRISQPDAVIDSLDQLRDLIPDRS